MNYFMAVKLEKSVYFRISQDANCPGLASRRKKTLSIKQHDRSESQFEHYWPYLFKYESVRHESYTIVILVFQRYR